MLFSIQILHKLGSKDSIFPKAFENNNMNFFLEGGGGGRRVECKTECEWFFHYSLVVGGGGVL